MQSKKINELGTSLSPAATDLITIGDPSTGQLKKATLNQIAAIFGSSGTVNSVALSIGTMSAFSVSGSPVTTSGTLSISALGTTLQYIRGNGTLATLNTSVVPESGNLYYTDTRARAAITLTTTGSSGASTYTSGALNIPTYTLSGLGGVPTTRTITINGTTLDLSADRTWTIAASGVSSFNTRTGSVSLTSGDVTGALGFTPISASFINATNPLFYSATYGTISIQAASSTQGGYLTSANWNTFNNKQDALGYTPYNASNPAGYISGINSSMVTTALGYTPYNSSNPAGYITGINSTNVINALGYTPYNSSNPTGYITAAGSCAYATSAGSISGYNNPVTTGTANTIAYRDGNGYLYAVAFFESSDIRFKNVLEVNPVVSVDKIDVIKFNRKNNASIRYGYSAQQVKEYLPEAVSGEDELVVNYSDVHTLKIAQLEGEIKELKEIIKTLIK